MPEPLLRLSAIREPDLQTVRFAASFAAPKDDSAARCAPAQLAPGDGSVYDLGLLCSPTSATWPELRSSPLATHRYADAGPYLAQLRWGDVTVQSPVNGADGRRTFRRGPLLTMFSLSPVHEQPYRRLVRFRVDGLAAGQLVRLDGGAGEARIVPVGADTAAGELELSYAKPGAYTVSLDVLDEDGFWIATVAQSPLELAEPSFQPAEPLRAPAEGLLPPPDETRSRTEPWLPYRNFKASHSGVKSFTRPGGANVSRFVGSGVWLSARDETVVGGQRWFQTAGGDWVRASDVGFFEPTSLRGLLLGEAEPPPPPPPPPPGDRRAVVTATTLNVRARPGLGGNNPPVATLRAGAEVIIREEARVEGVLWYRISEGRWIHSGFVRLMDQSRRLSPPPTGRNGVVTAATLNVRARPGVLAGNPPTEVLQSGAEVTIQADERVGDETWYRIGDERWVAGQWVRVLDEPVPPVGLAVDAAQARLPFGWVVPDSLPVRARPGTAADNAPVAELKHYDVVRVLEERAAGGQGWLRIGDDRWVDGRSIGVARFRPRPSSISATARWVAVCLSEQTLVAYEGDLPVYASLVSTGAGGTPTVQGIFRTWQRLPTGKMAGPGYYIEDVTWTCYFHGGYALHTAYWHDKFGTVRSHGCVNMTPYDAWWIYQWSAPAGPHSPVVYVYWK